MKQVDRQKMWQQSHYCCCVDCPIEFTNLEKAISAQKDDLISLRGSCLNNCLYKIPVGYSGSYIIAGEWY